jgi:GLPGLI family protein
MIVVFLLQGFVLAAQNNYTISYYTAYLTDDSLKPQRPFDAFKIFVQDTFAYCTYTQEGLGTKLKMPVPLGSGWWAKWDFYNKKSNTSLFQMGRYNKPDQWQLIERVNDTGTWTITGEKKVIMRLECTKATGEIRKKKYTIWFANELKGGYGPFMMTNLPGPILEEINEEDGFRTIAYEILYSSLPIVEPNYCKKIFRKE